MRNTLVISTVLVLCACSNPDPAALPPTQVGVQPLTQPGVQPMTQPGAQPVGVAPVAVPQVPGVQVPGAAAVPTVVPASGVPAAQVAPVALTPEAQSAIEKLKTYAGSNAQKGLVVNQNGVETLVLKLKRGDLSIGAIPSPAGSVACQAEKRALKKGATWWYFEGANPVALQLTRVSADIWRYDPARKCLTSYLVWEGLHKEMSASETLNMWYAFSEKPLPPAKELKLSTTNLSKKKVSSSPLGIKASFEKKADIFGQGEVETIQIFTKTVVVKDASGKIILNHDLKLKEDNFDSWEYHPYLINAATVLKNDKGESFVKITRNFPHEGSEDVSTDITYWVYQLYADKPAELIATKSVAVGEADMSENEPGEKSDFYDYRHLLRDYKTQNGSVQHDILKDKRVHASNDCTKLTDKKCKGKNKRITQWIFTPTNGKPVNLFKMDWSAKM